MFRRIAVVTVLAALGLVLVALTFIPPHATAPMDSTSGFVVDQTYDVVWGHMSPGATVTVARGTDYGAAQADGVGFFWTPLWQPNGQPADVVAGGAISVYVNGVLSATITPRVITGTVDVLNDRVTGRIDGDTGGTLVTVTLAMWELDVLSNPPRTTATTDPSGAFTATLVSNDVGPHNRAQVEYAAGPHRIHGNLYPQRVFHINNLSGVEGFAAPGQLVTVTAYITQTSSVRSTATAMATRPHGYYANDNPMTIEPSDVVKVDLGGGTVVTTIAQAMTTYADPALNRVTGTCSPNKKMRVWAWDWRLSTYAEADTMADAAGRYTSTFSGFDLRTSRGIYPGFADEAGNEVWLNTRTPGIQAVPNVYSAQPQNLRNSISGGADAPGVPYTVTLYDVSASATYVVTGTTDKGNNIGTNKFTEIAAGDVVTVQTATWMDSMTVANIAAMPDTANDRVLGSTDIPGWVVVLDEQWKYWDYPTHGRAGVSTTASSPFTATFTGFDVRDGSANIGSFIRVWHYDTDYNTTYQMFQHRYFQASPPYSSVSGWSPAANQVITGTLRKGGTGATYTTSQDNNPDPWRFKMNWGGQRIEAGDTITITNGSNWTEGMAVSNLTISADEANDRVSGVGPQTLLHVDGGREDSGFGVFAPGEGYAVDTAFLGHDLQWGDDASIAYQAISGNLVQRSFSWPKIQARYGPDTQGNNVHGEGAAPNATVYVTVTRPGVGIVGTAAATSDASGYYDTWDLPAGVITPGNVVTVNFANGYVESMTVLAMTAEANADTDIVTVTGPISTPVYMDADGPNGWWDSRDYYDPMPVIGATGYVTFDLGNNGYDIVPGTRFDIYAQQYHNHSTQYIIPAPDLHVEKWHEGNGQVAPGGSVVFGIRYRNDGDDAAPAILTDTLPFSTTYVADSSGFPAFVSGRTITWNLGTLGANSPDYHFHVVLTNTANVSDTLLNAVDIGTPQETNWGDNHAEASASVVAGQSPDVYVVHLYTRPWDSSPGQLLRYIISYGNSGQVASGPVWLSDTLPLSTTLVTWQSGYSLWTAVITTGGIFALYAPALPGGYNDRIYLDVRLSDAVTYGAQISNTIEITTTGDTNTSNNVSTKWNSVNPPCYDVGVGWWGNRMVLTPGSEIYYEINLNNGGNSLVHDAVLTDTLPAGVTFVRAERHRGPGSWISFPPSRTVGNQLAWDLGDVDRVHSSPTIGLYLRINDDTPPGTVLTNCATGAIREFDANPHNNTACVTDTVRPAGPNLRETKSHEWWGGPDRIYYYIHFQNVGTITEYNVAITDTFPLSMTLNDWWISSYGGDLGGVSSNVSGNQFVVTLGKLDVGEPYDLTMDLSVPSVPNGTLFTNTVEVTTPPGDVYPDDNRQIYLHGAGPDLNIQKYLIGGTPKPGQLITYTLYFRNDETWSTMGNVWITDVLPVGLEFITSTLYRCDSGTYLCPRTPDYNNGRTLAWNYGQMGNGDWNDYVVTVRVTDTAKRGDLFTNTASIASDNPISDTEPFYNNNIFTYTVMVPTPIFQIGKVVAGNRVAGTVVTYTVTVTNAGNEQGTGVYVTDTLPAGLTYVFGGDGAYTNGKISWPWWDVEPDGGTASGWFRASLTCTAGFNIVNNDYGVRRNDQGVQNPTGAPVTLTVLAPAFNAAFDQSAAVIAAGATVYFTDTSTTNGTPIVARGWQFGDGATASGSQASHVYPAAGRYTVTLTITDSCGYAATRSVPNAADVHVPALSIGKQAAGASVMGLPLTYTLTVNNSDTVAPATGVVITDAMPVGGSHVSGGNYAGGVVTLTIGTVPPSEEVSASWVASTCQSNLVNRWYRVAASDQGVSSGWGTVVTTTFYPPALSSNFDFGPSLVVAGATVLFTNTSSTNGSSLRYDWDYGDGSAHAFTANTWHVYTREGEFIARLTVTDVCSYSDVQMAPVIVSRPNLVADFDQSAASVVVSTTVYFTDTSTTNGPPIVGRLWRFGDGGSSTSQNPSHRYRAVGTYTVSLLITDSLDYTATYAVPNAVVVSLSCAPLTSISFAYAPAEPIIHAPIVFTATYAPLEATQPITYVWDWDDGVTTTATSAVVQHTYTISGMQVVRVAAYNTCTPAGVTSKRSINIAPMRVYLPLVLRQQP